MQARISMITLGVKDLEKAVQFYQEGLGLPRLDSPPGVAFFPLAGTWLGLYGWDALAEDGQVPAQGSGFRGVALAHNLSSKEAVDQLLKAAKKAGATITKAAEDTFWGGYSGYFADLDGHLWEVAYNPFMWIGPPEEAPQQG